MAQRKLHYDDFAHRIDLDAFYEAMEWSPVDQDHRGNDWGFCPWPENHSHGDTTGKFAIHREKMVYNCYVCGGGSLLSLAMELWDFDDVDDATEFMYRFAGGDKRDDQEFVDDFLAQFEDVEHRVDTLPYFNERVLDRFEPAPDWWLDERGITHAVADVFGLRYEAHHIKKPPMKGVYAEDDPYSGPAIIIPHYWKGRLVGWQNRWLADDRPDWVKKYTNTSGFPKEHTIFGYDMAIEAQRSDHGSVIAVESVPSSLFLWSLGYPSVATFGSGVNEAQMRALRRFTEGLILWEDPDTAGKKWLNTNTEYLKRYVPVWHLPPDEGKPDADAGDYASSHYPAAAVLQRLNGIYQPGLDF